MLESGLTRSLIAKFLQHSSLAVREFRAANLNTMNEATDGCVCETLVPDVVAPEAHQNNCSCVRNLVELIVPVSF